MEDLKRSHLSGKVVKDDEFRRLEDRLQKEQAEKQVAEEDHNRLLGETRKSVAKQLYDAQQRDLEGNVEEERKRLLGRFQDICKEEEVDDKIAADKKAKADAANAQEAKRT